MHSSPTHPTIHLSLTPQFDPNLHHVTSLCVQMIISGLSFKSGEAFQTINMWDGNVPSNRYDGDRLRASDRIGAVPFSTHDDGIVRSWHAGRNTEGPLTVEFEALPRIIEKTTKLGSRVDIQICDGGLVGVGNSFIPVPPDDTIIYDISVSWDLSAAPPGTSTSWTFGDEDNATKSDTVAKALLRTVFAVGPIKKYCRRWTSPSGIEQEYGFYWFGSISLFDPKTMAPKLQSLFSEMATFFRDTQPSYRIYVRRRPYRGFGGGAFSRSFILEYSNGVAASEDEVFRMLAHEMVHNWPHLQGTGLLQSRHEGTWYNEGSSSVFLDHMNILASSYYTSPAVHMTTKESNVLAHSDLHAQRLPYVRGGMHLIDLNAKIKAASDSKRSIDYCILALLALQEARKPFGALEWLGFISNELGRETAARTNQDMASGKLIVPTSDALGPDFEIFREDQYIYELGFDYAGSSGPRVVQELVKGSRAEKAGLRDGDELVWTTPASTPADYYKMMLDMVVRRDGKELKLSYWPRGWEKVGVLAVEDGTIVTTGWTLSEARVCKTAKSPQ